MISGDLEYLINSLPYLSFSQKDTLETGVNKLMRSYAGPDVVDAGLDAILDSEARKFLSSTQYEQFSTVTLQNIHENKFRQSKNHVLSGISNFMHSLKSQLRDVRIQRRKRQGAEGVAIKNMPIEAGNPLEEQTQILQLMWTAVNDLSAGHYSDYDALLTYKLKLMILMRYWSFDQQLGYEKYTKLSQNS